MWLGDARGHTTRFSSGRKIAEKVRAPKRENVKNNWNGNRLHTSVILAELEETNKLLAVAKLCVDLLYNVVKMTQLYFVSLILLFHDKNL